MERSRLNTEGKKKRYTSRQFWYDSTPGVREREKKGVLEHHTSHITQREKSYLNKLEYALHVCLLRSIYQGFEFIKLCR